ncbi:hypothetical protein Hdeb2414_s0013g00410061 [Helianthus debilis subsp. tardiflorus]
MCGFSSGFGSVLYVFVQVWVFGSVFESRFGSTRFDSVKPSQRGSTDGQLGSAAVNTPKTSQPGSHFRFGVRIHCGQQKSAVKFGQRQSNSQLKDPNARESRLGNDNTKSYLASFAQEYSGEFITLPFTVLHFSKCFRGGKTCTFCKAYKNYF